MVARGFHTPYVLVQFQCPQLWRCGGVWSPRYPVKVKIASSNLVSAASLPGRPTKGQSFFSRQPRAAVEELANSPLSQSGDCGFKPRLRYLCPRSSIGGSAWLRTRRMRVRVAPRVLGWSEFDPHSSRQRGAGVTVTHLNVDQILQVQVLRLPLWACDLTAKVRGLDPRYGGSNPLRPTRAT